MVTPEEAQQQGQANQMLENNLSSVHIFTKTDMKTGRQYTDWEIKCKHENVYLAKDASMKIDQELRERYGTNNK